MNCSVIKYVLEMPGPDMQAETMLIACKLNNNSLAYKHENVRGQGGLVKRY